MNPSISRKMILIVNDWALLEGVPYMICDTDDIDQIVTEKKLLSEEATDESKD